MFCRATIGFVATGQRRGMLNVPLQTSNTPYACLLSRQIVGVFAEFFQCSRQDRPCTTERLGNQVRVVHDGDADITIAGSFSVRAWF